MQLNSTKILWSPLLGAAVGAVINAVLYFIGKAMGAFPDTLVVRSGQVGGIPLVAVIGSSIVPGIFAVVVLWLLNRFTANPSRIFVILAVVICAASFVTPFSIGNGTTLTVVFLEIMHVITAASITWFALNFSRKSELFAPQPSPSL